MSESIERISELESRFVVRTIRDAADELDLRYGVFFAGTGAPKRYVVFLNGRTEWLEKYCYLATDLELPKDTAFLTWDHRGQGASGGARAYVEDYEAFAKDAVRIVDEVCGDKPYVLVSHSMGGLISLYATLKGYLKPKTLVLASPLLGMPDDPVPRKLAKPIASVLNQLFLGALSSGGGSFTKIPFERNRLTHSIAHYRRMQATPYPVPGATFGWVAATFKALDYCFDPSVLARLAVPTFVLAGSEESVVDRDAFQTWVQVAAKHAQADVQLRMIPGARHELFSEIPSYYLPTIHAVKTWLAPYLK